MFRAVIRPGMTVVDVGAHVGYYSTLAAELVGPSGKVFAFEPEPRSRSMLRKSIDENGYDNVIIVPMALSGTSGEAELIASSTAEREFFSIVKNRGTDRLLHSVQMTTLHEFLKDDLHVDVGKIDVEGADLAVVTGMTKVIDANPDLRMLIEWVPQDIRLTGYPPVEFVTRVFHNGFNVCRADFDSDELVPLGLQEALRLCRHAMTNLFLSRSAEDWAA